MRRLWFAIFLFVFVVCTCIGGNVAIKKMVEPIVSNIENGNIEEAFSEWASYETTLGALLPHSEIDEINRLFVYVKKAQEIGEDKQYKIDSAALVQQLNRLPELGSVDLKNIL